MTGTRGSDRDDRVANLSRGAAPGIRTKRFFSVRAESTARAKGASRPQSTETKFVAEGIVWR